MDKKNTLIGLGMLALGFLLFMWQARQMQEYEREQRLWQLQQQQKQQQQEQAEGGLNGGVDEPAATPESVGSNGSRAVPRERDPAITVGNDSVEAAIDRDSADADTLPAETVTLENGHIRVRFTNAGGGIERVSFYREDADPEVDPYVFNEKGEVPAMSLSFVDGIGRIQPYLRRFEVVRQGPYTIVFRRTLPEGLTYTRTYRLASPEEDIDPYIIRHELRVENSGEAAKRVPSLFLNLGLSTPLAADAYSMGEFLNFSYYTGEDMRYLKGKRFLGSNGFLGMGRKEPQPEIYQEVANLEWASVKNQFFVTVLREILPEGGLSRAKSIFASSVDLENGESRSRKIGIRGNLGFELGVLAGNESTILGTEYYVGPKDFIRLQSLGQNQEKLMQYWGPDMISQALTILMYGIHQLIPSWGASIVLMTLLIKLLFWPLTDRGMRSQKINAVKMAPLQEEMKTLREKYKDNPRAMQTAMADLYKKHDINPAAMMGGCIPMLIQIPIFIGLYGMLRVAPELRFSQFLWIDDLSQPDTVAMIGGFPLNLIPLIYGVAMTVQMRMTPMPETADETQQMTFKMMRFMPIFLVFLFYNFAAALPVYFTTQALLTMLQQYLLNKRLEPEIEAIKAAQKEGKTGKAVTAAAQQQVNPKKAAAEALKKERKAAAQQNNPLVDGLGATRRLKGSRGGSPSTKPKRRKRK